MWTFFSIAVMCATAIYLARRAEPLIKVGITLRARQPHESQPHEVPMLEPIPPDLMNLALQESEDWARNGMLRTMQDMYERCRDWNVVRAAYGGSVSDSMS